jgi:hypothetical protein
MNSCQMTFGAVEEYGGASVAGMTEYSPNPTGIREVPNRGNDQVTLSA